MDFIRIYICATCEKHLRTDYPTGESSSPDVPVHCGTTALMYERFGYMVMRKRQYDWIAHIWQHPKFNAVGATREEAIGALWLAYPSLFHGPTQEQFAKEKRGEAYV